MDPLQRLLEATPQLLDATLQQFMALCHKRVILSCTAEILDVTLCLSEILNLLN